MAIRLTLIMVVILISFFTPYVYSKKYVMINFGDSNSDSGENVYATGTLLSHPYGELFDFHQPISRYSNGRIYLDFLCESLEIPYLSPYLQSLGSDFSHGVNFAYWGSITEDNTTKNPYPLPTQIKQFIFFQNFTRLLRSQGKGPMITDEEFGDAIYTIDIGQNDLFGSFVNKTAYSDIVSSIIPTALESIESAVKNLYGVGARKYYLYNTGPLGCLPSMSSGNSDTYSNDLDGAECKIVYNDGSKAFNKGFAILCDKLRSELMGATVVCVDMYSIKYDLFAHLSDYGFPSAVDVTVDWSHYNDAASKIIASKILSGAFSQPQIKLTDLCAH